MRAAIFAGGVVVGIGATLAVMQLRSTDAPTPSSITATAAGSAASVPASVGAGTAADPRDQTIVLLRQRVAELEAAAPGVPGEQGGVSADLLEHGLTTGDDWWNAMKSDPAWDAAQATLVRDRLRTQLGVSVAADAIECKTRCCRIAFSEEVFDDHGAEITSAVGLGFGMPGGHGTSGKDGQVQMTACWQRNVTEQVPDRAVERAALLAKAASAIAACGSPSPAITLEMWLTISAEGDVTKVQSNKVDLASPVAACAESALLAASAFAPAPSVTSVPLRITLGR